MASISLICAGFANVALASTVRLTISHELPANRANIQSGLAANATPTPSTTSNTGVLAFADYIQNRETKGWSSEVYRKYEKEQVIGKLILDLSGTIVEIDKDSHGFYLALNVKAGDPKIDAYAYIPEREILNFSANQKVRLSGLIFDTWVQNLMIKDVVFTSGGKAPTKAATATAAKPTAVPTKASSSGSGTKTTNNATTNANANLRSGPGTNYPVVGATKKGDAIAITGRDSGSTWFQLSNGYWLSASLIANPPKTLGVVSAPPAPVAAATKAPVAGVVVVPTATTPAVLAAIPTATTKSPASTTSGETVSQRNAKRSAQDYLRYSAFSRSGLIGQLKYEGFSEEDAAYAVDTINPNWNDQAVKETGAYLKSSAFSRSGLIGQLMYGGFTQEQAEFGVNGVAIDWNAQAAKSAEAYLKYSAFSRDSLIEQLKYEGFTQEQAEYGVSKVGL
jgi:SOS response regulatory protein OraA/RecX